ncbi:hypothetical protein B7463_g10154, partial [Scytalidium lignicola]
MPITSILTVTLHEARGLTASSSDPVQGFTKFLHDIMKLRVFESYFPHAVVGFDKSQIICKSHIGPPDAPVWTYGHNSKFSFDVTHKTSLQIWLYQDVLAETGTTINSFLGTVIYRPSFKEEENVSAEWQDLCGGTGAVLIILQFVPNRGFSLGPENFAVRRLLDDSRGKGRLVRSLNPKAKNTSLVRWPITAQINNPFIATLKLNLESPQGKNGVIGVFVSTHQLSQHLKKSNEASITEYPAPEPDQTHDTHLPTTKIEDWWSLGVIIYKMLTGHRPFTTTDNHDEIHQTTLYPSLTFPDNSSENPLPPDAKDLVIRLLDRDPLSRLGANGSAEIKAHPFFGGIDWA